MKFKNVIWITVLLNCSCSPHSMEDFYSDGKAQTKKLITILSKIENEDDLLKQSSKIKKMINRLVDLMIAAKEFESLNARHSIFTYDEQTSDELKNQLKRIYSFERGGEIFEDLQRDALHKLDLHYQKQAIN